MTTWKDRYFGYYSQFYNPSLARLQSTYAAINFVLALLTLGHWTTYLFGFRFIACGLTVIVDRYYEQWRRDNTTYQLGRSIEPPEETQRFMESDIYRTCLEQQDATIRIVQHVAYLQLFVGCVHQGWFDQAAGIQRYMDT